jgi:hypothetical protein
MLRVGLLVLGAASQGVLAQDAGSPEAQQGSIARPDNEEFQQRTYGTADTIILQIPSAAFHPLYGDAMSFYLSYNSYMRGDNSGDFVAPLNLPNGALVNFLDLYYHDTDPGPTPALNDVYAKLWETGGDASLPSITEVATVSSSGSGGFGYSFKLINPPLQIDNRKRYHIQVYAAIGSALSSIDKSFGGVNVWYRLQMSPAPATATFGDVPTNFLYFRAIEALAASGITGGCGGGNFCPNQNVTRGEMAAFLARALGLHWPL